MTSPVHYQQGMFPPANIEWTRLIPLIGPAAAAVARYDGVLAAIPDASVLLSPLTTQEAVLSSRIEGTQATMGEVLEFEANVNTKQFDERRKADIHEVLNYRRAIRIAEELLQTLPLSLRVVREVHEVLLDGVRGQGKSPGVFRRIPNWIGPPGCSIDEARFIPASADKLDDAMGRWERYIHEPAPDRLVQLAILHAEFEAIHPFLDGNGRLGRMFIPLVMWQGGLIQRPMFYLSAYLEAHREEYYDRLLAVSRDSDWTGWCAFFLQAIKLQADENHNKALTILKLYEELKPRVIALTRSQYSIYALDWIFNRPIFRSTDFIADAQVPDATARRLLKAITKEGILKVLVAGSGRRASIVTFPRLLNIAEGRDLF